MRRFSLARLILSFYGGGCILVGAILLVNGAVASADDLGPARVYVGLALLFAGAPFLAMAKAIGLLHEIAGNTRPLPPAIDAPLTMEESIARNAKVRLGR